MKKLLLLSCLLSMVSMLWAQERRIPISSQPPSVMGIQEYWDSVKKKNQQHVKAPNDLIKKKTSVSVQKQRSPILILPSHINKHVMPVLTPDSSYVYTMPGTHAFDKTISKGGAFYATEQASAFTNQHKPYTVTIKRRD